VKAGPSLGGLAVAIVGAGIAGLACGAALQAAGQRVTLFDKGRRPGGRLATRDSPWGPFDHGAASFNAGDGDFGRQVAEWAAAGLLAPDPALPGAWLGVPCMNALPAAQAAALDLRRAAPVGAIGRGADGRWLLAGTDGAPMHDGGFDAVVVATPPEQALPLLAPWSATLAGALAGVHSEPCWTVMAAWDGAPEAPRLPQAPLGPLCGRAESTEPLGPLACVRREDLKPGRARDDDRPRWLLAASPYWSAHNLELAAPEVVRHLLDDLQRLCGRRLAAPAHAAAHRWRYAEVPQPLAAPCGWDAGATLGACGDAWHAEGGASSVERAWLSGRAMAQRLAIHAAGNRGRATAR
jgi:predicted NAD/FAD-dependent oxidoreductase